LSVYVAIAVPISLWDFLNLLPLGIKRHIVGNNGLFGFTSKNKESLNMDTFLAKVGRIFREEVRFCPLPPQLHEPRVRRPPVRFMEVDDVALSPSRDTPVVLSSCDVLLVYSQLVLTGSVDFGFIGRVHGGAQNLTTFNFHEGKAGSDVEKGEYVGHHLLVEDELYEVVDLHRSPTDDHTRWTVEKLSKEERGRAGILNGWNCFYSIQPASYLFVFRYKPQFMMRTCRFDA
jgi:hypothetical protein